MQLRLGLLSVLAGYKMALAIPATSDIYYHEQTEQHLPEAVWTFSDQGVTIFTADGETELMKHSNATLGCGESCFYFNIATDGRKYVWGNALHSALHRIDVFSLHTGEYLGGVATCSTPLDMDFIPNREELWIRCAGDELNENTTETATGHLRVIHTNSLGAVSEDIRLTEERSYGYAVFHSSLGNYGYATDNTQNKLWKVDLAYREVVGYITLDQAHSSYDATYSVKNKHIFLRSRVCCTCGFEGADAATCGRGPGFPGQIITTGPSAGRTDLNGTCGDSCEGSLADTIGVMEFDTVLDTFVANHQPLEAYGATPQASPDGQHVLLLANDGGKNVRVLKAGENGQASTVAFDLAVNFENVPPGAQAISDFAFIDWNDRTILALASGYDNNLVLADLSATPPTINKVPLSTSASPTGGTSGRMIEWAYGTEYLWVDGSANEEVYVLKLDANGGAAVHRTIAEAPVSKMIYVENFGQRAVKKLMAEMIASTQVDDGLGTTKAEGSSSSDTVPGTDLLLQQMEEAGLLACEENDDPSIIAIVAFVIGSLSLLMNIVVIMHYFFSSSMGAASKQCSTGTPDKELSNSLADIPDDSRTLGSKLVA